MNEMNEQQFGFGHIIRQSKLTMPDANFEQLVMARLKEEAELKKSGQYNWYSALFFNLFVIMGYVVSTRFTGYFPAVAGLSHQLIKLLLQVAFIVCILHRADYFVKYFRHRNLDVN